MSRQIMRQALEFCQYAWQDIQMDEYAFEQLDKTIAALEAELAKPTNEFHPDWDTLKPYHDRIAELEAQLAKPEYSDLRKAAEMALEALEMHVLGFDGVRKMELAIEALESALAKPDETETLKRCLFQMQEAAKALAQPEHERNSCPNCGKRLGTNWVIHSCTQTISEPVKERISEPLANQEPVAYWNGQDLIRMAEEVSSVPNWTDYYHIPLYSKPQSKPLIALTDDEITRTYEVSGHCQTLRSKDAFAVFSFARAIEAALGRKNQ